MEVTKNLRNAFRFNALFSAVCAICLLLASSWWALQFGDIDSLFVAIGGIGLIVFAAYLTWVSSTAKQPKFSILSIIVSDWLYVIGAALVLLFAWEFLSVAGVGFLASTGLVVSVAAEWQRRAATN